MLKLNGKCHILFNDGEFTQFNLIFLSDMRGVDGGGSHENETKFLNIYGT